MKNFYLVFFCFVICFFEGLCFLTSSSSSISASAMSLESIKLYKQSNLTQLQKLALKNRISRIKGDMINKIQKENSYLNDNPDSNLFSFIEVKQADLTKNTQSRIPKAASKQTHDQTITAKFTSIATVNTSQLPIKSTSTPLTKRKTNSSISAALNFASTSALTNPDDDLQIRKLCGDGDFIQIISSTATCKQFKACDIELQLTEQNELDKNQLDRDIETLKKKNKGSEKIPGCQKKTHDTIEKLKIKKAAGKKLSESEEEMLNNSNDLNFDLLSGIVYCTKAQFVNVSYCCGFSDSDRAEWFINKGN